MQLTWQGTLRTRRHRDRHLSGADKGKTGKVLRILTGKDRVVVEGVNRVWKHVRPNQRNPQGGRIQKDAPIHLSNVMPLDPTTGKGTRVKFAEVRTAASTASRSAAAPTWARPARSSNVERPSVSDGPRGEVRPRPWQTTKTKRRRATARRAAAPPRGKQQPKKEKKAPKPEAQQVEDDGAPQVPAPPPRLIAHYREKVVPALVQQFGYKNQLAVPRLEKIVISMGLGKAVTAGEKGKMETAEKELGIIAGQQPGPLQGEEERRQLQGPRGPGDRPEGHAPRRPDVRVPRPADHAGVPPREGLPRREPRRVRQERELQLRVHRADGVPRGRRRDA